MDEAALRVVISGRVQGVGYRVWMVGEAWRRNIRGWVRNRRDGTVEALLIGRQRDVDRLVEACRVGPRQAQVASIACEDAADDGTPKFYEKPMV